MQLAHYLGLLHKAESTLGDAFREVAEGHFSAAGSPVSATRTRRRSLRSPSATARRRTMSPSASIRRSSRARVTGRSGCCATCTTSI